MQRQDENSSRVLWQLEKLSIESLLNKDNLGTKLIEVMDPLIESGEVRYAEFVESICEFLTEIADENDEEKRKNSVEIILQKVIDKYSKPKPEELLEKLNARIIEKIDECNKILDEIQNKAA